MRQIWRHLGFLHWAVDCDVVARLLPPGLEPDTYGGIAYVGIVPFTIPVSRLAGLGIPLAPSFHELNLRTYVRRKGHSPGVWFFSLDATSRFAVLAARLTYALPYFKALISLKVTGDPRAPTIIYESQRRTPTAGAGHFRGRYGPAGPAAAAAPGTLEFFFVERYLLYAWNGRSLSEARVHHVPYSLQPAVVTDLTETLTAAAGLPQTIGAPAQAHYSREVDVRIYRPHRVAT